MNGREALATLQKPVFGDESHIEALKIYRQIALLKEYRENGDEIDMEALDEFYDCEEMPEPEDLTADQLDEELNFWKLSRLMEEQ